MGDSSLNRRKRESVHATFHYLVRHVEDEAGSIQAGGFSENEFAGLVERLQDFPEVDLDDEETLDKIRFRNLIPIEDVELIDDRTVFGKYRAAYWGHAYDNTAVGKIPSDSISLRPFFSVCISLGRERFILESSTLGNSEATAV